VGGGEGIGMIDAGVFTIVAALNGRGVLGLLRRGGARDGRDVGC
jgi:hypothetical protein